MGPDAMIFVFWMLSFKQTCLLSSFTSFWKFKLLLNYGVGEDSLEFLESKKIKSVNPKGNQSWIFIGRTDAEAEAPILWPPDPKSWLNGNDPAGKDWRQEKKGMTGWDGWMAPLIQWTWVWANSGRQWRTEKPGMLQLMGSQRVGHNWSDLAHPHLRQNSFRQPSFKSENSFFSRFL